MNRSTKIAKNWGCVMLLSLAVLTSCNKDGEETQAPTVPEITLDEIIGGWDAEGYKWDLDNGKSTCYLMTEDGDDYARDENGKYITLTIREYCEQYAKDYNADPKNEIKGTPYDFADHTYEGTAAFTNITVTADQISVYGGQMVSEDQGIRVTCVSGAYTYDQKTGIMTVEDVAIESEPRTLKIDIWKDEQGRMNFRYTDFDLYFTPNYANTKEYYPNAPMIFYCQPGEPYIPQE